MWSARYISLSSRQQMFPSRVLFIKELHKMCSSSTALSIEDFDRCLLVENDISLVNSYILHNYGDVTKSIKDSISFCVQHWDNVHLSPAYNECGYNEHPAKTNTFLCIKIFESYVKMFRCNAYIPSLSC